MMSTAWGRTAEDPPDPVAAFDVISGILDEIGGGASDDHTVACGMCVVCGGDKSEADRGLAQR